jgi:hypothetical protein
VRAQVVLTGAKKRVDIYTAFENIFPVLNEFKKDLVCSSLLSSNLLYSSLL